MKKYLLPILLALIAPFCFAQSYPSPTYQNLTVLGTFTATGKVTTADLAAQAANTVLANGTGSTASPTAFAMPSCSSATSALNWTSGTGFTCGAVASAGANSNITSLSGLTTPLSTSQGGTGSANPADIIYYFVAGDNTAGLQAAINTAISAGATLQMVGSGSISGTETINSELKIVGQGKGVTGITASTTGVVFNVTTTQPVTFEDFTLSNSVLSGANTQVGIQVSPASGENAYSTFRNLAFYNQYNSINFVAASGWNISYCYFDSAINNYREVQVANTNNVDSGDSTITGSLFTQHGSPAGTEFGVLQFSSGGLRIVNNKFLNQQNNIVLDLATGAATSDLLIEANSLEGFTGSAITLERGGATGSFAHVIVNGNQFAEPLSSSSSLITLPVDPNGVWLTGLIITNNNYDLSGVTSSTPANVNSTNGLVYSNNSYITTSSTNIPVIVGSTVSNTLIGPNNPIGTFAASQIASTNNSFIQTPQTIAIGSITTSSGYGSLFQGTLAVTFPHSYAVAPTSVECSVPSAGGSISAGVGAGTVTTAGFTAIAWGVTSSGVVSGILCSTVGGIY